jgi:hypothetical protein
MGLIILFAAITGPALMWYTYRTHRQTWLLLLFPIIALLMTTILFGFAIFYDGFETIARIRSYTWYDAATKQGFAWSRQTYFSGMPPREGLKFGSKSEVTPYQTSHLRGSSQGLRISHTSPESGEQQYQRLLTAREQRQFLVRHPVQDMKLFEVQGVDETGQPKVVNLSNDSWPLAVFVDRNEVVWQAENVEPSKPLTFIRSDAAKAVVDLSKVNRNSGLQLPPGFVRGQQISIFGWMFNRYRGGWGSGQTSPLMENEINRVLTSQESLKAGSFVVVMENSPHIERPMIPDQTSKGFHVVGGSW